MPVLKRQPGTVPTLPLVNGGQEEADGIKREPNIQGDALPRSGLSEILSGNAHEKSPFWYSHSLCSAFETESANSSGVALAHAVESLGRVVAKSDMFILATI